MIPLVKVVLPAPADLMPVLEHVLYSGQISEGEQVYEFEATFGKQFDLRNVLAFSSGTAALHTALTLAGVRSGDEVISTPMTAEPTNLAILHSGGKVVWADIDPATGNIDPESIRDRITGRTKAIMVVHYAGYPVRLADIRRIADDHDIPLIEDCAHALGATYNGVSVGTVGDFGIFSFQAIKHMTTVDGGALVLNDSSRLFAARKFRWFGMSKGAKRTDVDISSIGYKYNMTNVAAAIGLVQLKSISTLLEKHISNGRFFDREFDSVANIEFAVSDKFGESSYWIYTLLSDDSDDIEKALIGAGIMASKLHRPNIFHSIFKDPRGSFPGLERFYKRLVHIPCGSWVTPEDRQRIVDVIKKG